jgi:cyanate lyase
VIDRQTATGRCRAAKRSTGLSFAELGKAADAHPTWVASVLEGQNTMSAEQADAVGGLLGLDADTVAASQVVPHRGSLPPGPITDR